MNKLYEEQGGMLKGCAILIGVLLILAGAAIAISVFGMGRYLDQYRDDMQAKLPEYYAQLKEKGLIPAEYADDYERMMALIQEGKANTVTLAVIAGLLQQPAEDGEVDQTEGSLIQSWNEFIKKNPEPTVLQLISFVYSDPNMQDIIGRFDSKLKTQIEQERAGGAAEVEPPAEAEAAPVTLEPLDPPENL
ncbi:MAG: hypothetical protein IT368_06590 [Candidatus Hydrogenedentes bacterium]|nr:hypothetical protein [Candidatus Hydrogenedentota bacterium]